MINEEAAAMTAMTAQVTRLEAGGRWPADIDVWHVEMPSSGLEPAMAGLVAEERERVERYLHFADRMRFAVTRATLRELLGNTLGVPPASLRFTTTRYGRPELSGASTLSFNVSHSGSHALIAMSNARRVGIDIERIDPAIDWQALAGLVCTEDEWQALSAEHAPRQQQRFFRCWTAKEAVLKTLGRGITENLCALRVGSAGEGIQRPVVRHEAPCAEARSVRYHWLTDIPGYMACIAFGEARDACAAPTEAELLLV
jgi:4'-phosphopantetheinyl transferase